jgi:uncharacterized RDD family membrane protein YckC
MNQLNHASLAEPASIGRRAAALLIDLMILSVPMLLGAVFIPFAGAIVVSFLYAPVMESSALQATIGKYWLGIQVVGKRGERIAFRHALIRYLVKNLSTLLVCIGYLMALFSRRNHTLHDRLSGTEVVYGRNESADIGDAWWTQLKSLFHRASGAIESGNSVSHASSKYEAMEKLQSLRDKGTLSEEEFQREKKALLEG